MPAPQKRTPPPPTGEGNQKIASQKKQPRLKASAQTELFSSLGTKPPKALAATTKKTKPVASNPVTKKRATSADRQKVSRKISLPRLIFSVVLFISILGGGAIFLALHFELIDLDGFTQGGENVLTISTTPPPAQDRFLPAIPPVQITLSEEDWVDIIAGAEENVLWTPSTQLFETYPELVRDAQLGERAAQFTLAGHLVMARNTPQDYSTARTLYGLAAQQGVAEAAFNYAVLQYLNLGTSVPAQEAELLAERIFAALARDGLPDAQIILGQGLLNQPTEENFAEKAAFWFAQAWQRGDPRGAFHLAQIYQEELIAGVDREDVIRLYQVAAQEGVAGAEEALLELSVPQ